MLQTQQQAEQPGVATPERDLRAALETLETALVTPIIAGEVGGWCDAVVQAALPAGDQIRNYIPATHKPQYKEIVEQDPEMVHQVTKLKEADAALLEQLDKFERHVQQVKQRGDCGSRTETELKTLLDLLVAEGTKLVVEVRKQLVAVQTWYHEAFNRDRGVGD